MLISATTEPRSGDVPPPDRRVSRHRHIGATLLFIIGRLGRAALIFLVATFAVFNLSALLPGDPAVVIAGENADAETLERVRASLGLDRPWYEQFGSWLINLIQGDFGTSIYYQTPVTELLASRLPATISLASVAICLTVIAGILGGLLAASYRGRLPDRIATAIATLGIVTPNFWVGMILVLVFSFGLGLFPAIGYTPITEDPLDWFAHIILPATAVALATAAELQRQTRSSVSDVLTQDFIRTARAQGLSRRTVLWQRALKNGALPLATVIGYQVSILLGGSIFVEKVFSINGLGTLAINAVVYKDLPVLQAVVVINAIIVISVNLLTDLMYTILNPKVRTA